MHTHTQLIAVALSAFIPFAKCTSTITTLAQQCWHEFPLSTRLLQSTTDGLNELFVPSGRTINTSQPVSNGNYGPWTHQPVCTEVLQSLGSKLCVYTNSSFSDGRGISIFTTPVLAEEFASLPTFQNPDALKDVNTFSGNWYTQEIPGKGMGMLAKKHLKFKDQVTAYTPVLIAHLEEELSTRDRERFYLVAVNQLPEATRNSYLQLAFVYGVPSVRAQDIVKANTFRLEINGHNHLAVFPESSRLNHACGPNAQYYIDPIRLTHFVQVTRPISPGEEITISYTPPLELTDVRRQHLQEGFHFTCSCQRCAAKDATDATLREMQHMQNALNDWSPSSLGTPKLAEKMLQLYRDEGLEGFMDIPYGFASLAYNAVGDSKKAEKYAKRAKEAILMKDGKWSPNFRIWVELLGDSKGHWSYKRRKA